MKHNKNIVTVTREQIKNAGLNPDEYLGKGVMSATVDMVKFLNSLTFSRAKVNYRKISAALEHDIKIVKWGSKEFWSAVPSDINAVTICSRNEILYYREGYGHYSNYTDDYRGGSRIPDGTVINQHWFVSSLYNPVKGIELDCLIDIQNADEKTILYRPKTKKKELDLDAIDWKMIPEWANKILVSERKYNDKMDVQIGDSNSYIDNKNVIRTHYIRKDHTRPAEDIDDKFGYGNFNYVLKNVPVENKIYTRPGVKDK